MGIVKPKYDVVGGMREVAATDQIACDAGAMTATETGQSTSRLIPDHLKLKTFVADTLGLATSTTNLFAALTTGQGLDLRASESSLAAQATVDLGSVATLEVAITGSGTITSFGSTPYGLRLLRFTGAATLTPGSSLILPGGASLTTTAGARAFAISDGNAVWTVFGYANADGSTPAGDLRYPRKDANAPLSTAERSQLLANIGAPYVVASSIGSSGYRKWSDGFIEQWGVSSTNGGSPTIIFPTSFLNFCDGVYACIVSVSVNEAIHHCNAGSYTASGATLSPRYATNGGAVAPLSSGLEIKWRAWGR